MYAGAPENVCETQSRLDLAASVEVAMECADALAGEWASTCVVEMLGMIEKCLQLKRKARPDARELFQWLEKLDAIKTTLSSRPPQAGVDCSTFFTPRTGANTIVDRDAVPPPYSPPTLTST